MLQYKQEKIKQKSGKYHVAVQTAAAEFYENGKGEGRWKRRMRSMVRMFRF